MTDITHTHDNVINNMTEINKLVSYINNSKVAYTKKNLSIHLHESEIKLFKNIVKHDKPHHKKIRVQRYKNLMENPDEIPPLFELHQELFLKRYKKLEKKGIINVIEKPDNGLAYDFEITDKGKDLIKEIEEIENKWEDQVTADVEDKEELLKLLKQVAIPSVKISYAIQKTQKGVY